MNDDSKYAGLRGSGKVIFGRDFDGIGELTEGRTVYLVYDMAVEDISDRISGLCGVQGAMGLDLSEQTKDMDSVLDICRFLLAMEADRDALLLAVGGGVLTDLAGFAASIYKRGIACSYIPTTLLSQVDASVGGKTGANLDGVKNAIGTFSFPEWTYICPEALETLPETEMECGIAEMLKTFIIGDSQAYRDAVDYFSAVRRGNKKDSRAEEKLAGFIRRAVEIKQSIVAKDPTEQGERRSLNLGHTFAHAIETVSGNAGPAEQVTGGQGAVGPAVPSNCRQGTSAPAEQVTGGQGAAGPAVQVTGRAIRHGEAVAMGIILAAGLSEERGVAGKGLAERLKADFRAVGLPTDCPYPVEQREEAMRNDKKSSCGTPRFVLIEEIGKVRI